MNEKLIVIGGTAAGLSAASRAKKLCPNFEIEVFERSGYVSYGSCGLPYFVGDLISDLNDLVSLSVEELKSKRGIAAHTRTEAVRIDRTAKTVTVRDLTSGGESEHRYDKLVIATGARPVVPTAAGIGIEGVHYLRTVEDGIALKSRVAVGRRATIVGGGFIGLELAEALAESGVKVTLCEAMPRLLPFLPVKFADRVLEELNAHGVKVILGDPLKAIVEKNGRAAVVETVSGRKFDCDMVVLSIGVMPETGLAAAAGLKLGLRGGIVVDKSMQTSDPSIWACGDCVEMEQLITGVPAYVPLGTTANKQGRIAGSNIGGQKERFPGVLGSCVTKVFDLFIASTGLSLEAAKKAGFAAAETAIAHRDRASYYPGIKNNEINLVVDAKSGRLLGAQAVGSESVAGRINVLVAAITAGMTVAQLNELDLVYAPPVAPVYDPILIAAGQAMKVVEEHE